MVQIDASFGVLRAGSKAFVRGIGTLYPEIRWPRSPIQVADHNLVSDIGSIAESVSESVRLPCAVVLEQHKSDATSSRIPVVGEGLVAVWALDCNRRRWRWKCIGAESESTVAKFARYALFSVRRFCSALAVYVTSRGPQHPPLWGLR